jgi:formate-dependent nitrite reductase membrane component NrfD
MNNHIADGQERIHIMAESPDYKLMLNFSLQKEWAGPPMWLEMSFGGTGGGLFLLGSAAENTLACVIGYLLLLGGKGLFLLADLGKPRRFLKVFNRPFGSWISFGAWVFLIFFIAGLLCILPYFTNSNFPPTMVAMLKIVAMTAAGILITYDGFFLAASVAVASWTTGMLAPLFASSALAAGCSLLLLLGDATPWLAWANISILALEIICLLSHFTAMHKGAVGSRKSKEILLRGCMAHHFIYGVVLAGIAIPLFTFLLLLFFSALPSQIIAISCIGEIACVVFMRYSFLKAGIKTPMLISNFAE